jgi:hypothetical protein
MAPNAAHAFAHCAKGGARPLPKLTVNFCGIFILPAQIPDKLTIRKHH